MNPNTGVFTFVNKHSVKTSYELEINVLTTDGTNNYELTVTGITLNVVCGSSSTTVTSPSLQTQYQVPNIPVRLQNGGTFESSNNLCPIQSHAVTTGTDNVEIVTDFMMASLGSDVTQAYTVLTDADG